METSELTEKSMYVDINEIQKKYLPLSKKVLRRFVQERFHVVRAGGRKILVQRDQLEDYLASQDTENICVSK